MLGVGDQVITLPFMPAWLRTTAETFIRRLVDAVEMKRLVVGPNFALGRQPQRGSSNLEGTGGAPARFTVDVGGWSRSSWKAASISSSRIRKALWKETWWKQTGCLEE
jgi:FAD synthase